MSSPPTKDSRSDSSSDRTDLRLSPETEAALEAVGTREHQVGDFRILREVGRGGMGVVYEAEQLSLDRRVALKVLPFAAILDERQLARFKTEAQAAARLHHPNIVPVHAVGCQRGIHFYAMQYINGQSLAEAIRILRDQREEIAGGPVSGLVSSVQNTTADTTSQQSVTTSSLLSTSGAKTGAEYCRTVARLMIQAAEALENAHQSGIVHRDVKPGNLLLEASNKLWVTDFGLALVEQNPQLTMTGDVVGTVRYMSPEQAASGRGVDHRTDIYSLGVTLYEALMLRAPFESDDRQELLTKIALHDPIAPRKLNPDIPSDLETIVLKAMEKDPNARYDTAQALADDLHCFLDNRTISAKRPTLSLRLQKWSRRHPAIVRSAMVVLVLFAISSAVSNALISREQAETQDALDRANENFVQSEINRGRAEAAANRNEKLLYVRGLGLAARAWQDGDGAGAAELMRSNPAVEDRPDLRGFEWYYLRRFLPTRHEIVYQDSVEITATAYAAGRVQLDTDSNPEQLTNVDGRLFFTADHKTKGRELWVVSGDGTDPRLVKDSIPGGGSSSPDSLTQVGQRLFFTADDGTSGRELWSVKDDGTELRLVADLHPGAGSSSPDSLTSVNGRLFFTADDGNGGREIWSINGDGTDARCAIDINPGSGSSNPRWLAEVDGRLFFAATDGSDDEELWMVNGDGTQPRRVHDLNSRFSSSPKYLTNVNGRLLFSCSDSGKGRELTSIDGDGNLASLRLVTHNDDIGGINPGDGDANPEWLTNVNGRLFFTVDDGVSGRELWSVKADGTDARLVKDIHRDGGSDPSYLTSVKDRLFFSADDGTNGRELWVAGDDGTEPRLAADLNSGSRSSSPSHLTAVGDRLFFTATTEENGEELWSIKYDGTDLRPFENLNDGPGSSSPRHLTNVSGRLFFSADDGVSGRGLWSAKETNKRPRRTRSSDSGGRLFAAGDGSGAIRIWDATRNQLIALLQGHLGPVHSLAFRPDGNVLASCGEDGTVRIWDVAQQRETRSMDECHGRLPVYAVAYSPDGTRLVTSGDDNIARVWDAIDFRSLCELRGHTRPIRDVAFSPDGHSVATASNDRTMRLWDAESGKPTRTLSGHEGMVLSVCYSPSGQYVISGSNDRTIRVWSSDSGDEVAVIQGHHDGVQSLVMLQDESTIIAGDRSGQLRVWRIQGKRVIDQFNEKFLDLYAVRLSPDGRYWAALRRDGRLLVRDVAMKRTAVVQSGIASQYRRGLRERLAFSPDGLQLYCADRILHRRSPSVNQWHRIEKLDVPAGVPGHFSPDGQILATGWNKEIKLWNPHDNSLLHQWETKIGPITGVRFSPDGSRLATWFQDRQIVIWDWKSATAVQTVRLPASHPADLEFEPYGTRFAICCQQGKVYIGDSKTEQLEPLDTGGRRCNAVSWLKDRNAIALSAPGRQDFIQWLGGSRPSETIGFNRSAKDSNVSNQLGQFLSHDDKLGVTVRDLHSLEVSSSAEDVLQGHTDRIWSLSVSLDGRRVITSSRDGTVRAWSLTANDQWNWLTQRRHSEDFIDDFQWSGSGDKLVLAQMGFFRVFEFPGGKLQAVREGFGRVGKLPFGFVCEAIACQGEGEIVATGHRDGRVQVWDRDKRQPTQSIDAFTVDAHVSTLKFSPDVKLLMAASRSDNLLKIWRTDTWQEVGSLGAEDCDDLAFSSDGKRLAYCDGREAVLWDTERMQLVRRFRGHSITVHGLAFSTDDRRLVTACEDRKLRIWDPFSGELLQTLVGHTASIRRVTFTPDNRTLVSGDAEGMIKLWHVETGQELYTMARLDSGIKKLAFDPSGKVLVVLADDGRIHVFAGE